MNYIFSTTEDYIRKLYHQLSIFVPEQIDMMEISSKLNIKLHFYDDTSVAVGNRIFLDKRLSSQEQWIDFGHETGHVLKHCGNQLVLPSSFIKLQESQAKNFCYHFCVPTFMLLEMDLPVSRNEVIQVIAETFNVPLDFAKKRFNRFETQLNGSNFQKEYAKMLKEPIKPVEAPGFIYLDDDLEELVKFERMLDRLNLTPEEKKSIMQGYLSKYGPLEVS
jgi:Zn-dependent peptidase ImmA (M78 family)